MSPSSESDIERAARKSRDWKARQAEIAEAAREDDEIRRRRRADKEQEQREHYQDGAWRNLVLVAVGVIAALLLFERISIGSEADNCLDGSKRPHQYNCAAQLTGSFWSWLIPSDTAEILRASAESNR